MKKFLSILFATVLATAALADEETKIDRDNSRLSVFVQPAISFLNFSEREYFQNAIDTIYADFRAQAVDKEESLSVAKQNFQKVNFCFPVMGGLQFQLRRDHFLSAGAGFIYDNESVVLTDRKNKAHNYSYTIQGVPMFLEYRVAIPTSLITLSNGSLFSIAVRWYWTLPGTEIYTTWGKLEAENSILGAGFGISLGYLVTSWNGLNVYGDIGFSSISVESKERFADIVPDGPEEKAKWNIGGLQLQIRVSFGLWNYPKEALMPKPEVVPVKSRKEKAAEGAGTATEPAKAAETPAAREKPAAAEKPATPAQSADAPGAAEAPGSDAPNAANAPNATEKPKAE